MKLKTKNEANQSKRFDAVKEFPLEIKKDKSVYYRLQLTQYAVWYTKYNSRDEITAFIVIDRSTGESTNFKTSGDYEGAYFEAEKCLGKLGGV